MSRLRRFNRRIFRDGTGIGVDSEDDNEISILPMDTEEQEELIQKFELSYNVRNKRYVNILSLSYLICSGLFLIFGTKRSGKEASFLVMGAQSIICSMITIRYELTSDYVVFKKLKLHVDNSRIQKLNLVLLVLIEWIGLTHFQGSLTSQMFCQLPILLFMMAFSVNRWARDMEEELNQLREMKYKYKNA